MTLVLGHGKWKCSSHKGTFLVQESLYSRPLRGADGGRVCDGLLRSLKEDQCLPRSRIFGEILVLYLKHTLVQTEYRLS